MWHLNDNLNKAMLVEKILIKRIIVLVFFSLFQISVSSAQRLHDIVPKDYFSLAQIHKHALSPNGRKVVFQEYRWDKTLDGKQADLWLLDVKTKKKQRLTFTNSSEQSPEWGSNGVWIYYLRTDDGDKKYAPDNRKKQVFRIKKTGGTPQVLTNTSQGVKGFQISKSGKHLYYSTFKSIQRDDQWSLMRNKHKQVVYGYGKNITNPVYILDLNVWREKLLIDHNKVLWDFAVTDDESKIAMITTENEELVFYEGRSEVEVLDLHSEKRVKVPDAMWRVAMSSPNAWLFSLAWSDDGNALAFKLGFDGYQEEMFVVEYSGLELLHLSQIKRHNQLSFSNKIHWKPGSRDLCYGGEYFGYQRVYCTKNIKEGKQGKTLEVTPGNMVVSDFDFNTNGKKISLLHHGLDHFGDLYIASTHNTKGNYERLSNINPQVDNWKLTQIKVVKWQAPDGTNVEGILELPAYYEQQDGPIPTLVQIHRGPTYMTAYKLKLDVYGHGFFPARGWAVFSPNYRGSTGYGDDFVTDLIENEADKDVGDILSGLDFLIAEGYADPDRLAISGWSNGGYLSNVIISMDKRFKAASIGAGEFDKAMEWTTKDTPGNIVNLMNGLPWEKPLKILQISPIYHVDKIKTPTLIHAGTDDARVPAEHAKGLYQALSYYLHVPSELILYQGEEHLLRKYSSIETKMMWDISWFDHYVLGKSLNAAE